MKKIVLVFIFILLFSGCSNQGSSRLDKILDEDNYIVIDVRTEEEYNTGHVVGALNIPYDEIDEHVDLDKNKTILVYCKSGNRSGTAYTILKDLGYKVFDLGAYQDISLEKE